MNWISNASLGGFSVMAVAVFLGAGCDRQTVSTPSSTQPPSRKASAPAAPVVVPMTNMVQIKAGTFQRMEHPAALTQDFWMARHEVTQSEFSALIGKNPSKFAGQPDAPVEKITFYEAVAYCARLTKRERKAGRIPDNYEYRLPTEAEWEYACRAGTTNFFSFGDSEELADHYAWTAENSDESTHPVGLKKPNPWGLYDMHGNVWEWCLDWYADYPPGPATDPAGPATGEAKVFRGGGWSHDAPFARSANRFTMAPSNGIHFVGFRVVLAKTSG